MQAVGQAPARSDDAPTTPPRPPHRPDRSHWFPAWCSPAPRTTRITARTARRARPTISRSTAPAADRRQNTHALRRRKRQIKPPHPIAPQPAPQRLARARIQARQQPPEILARALARQPQLTRRLTPPHARPLPRRQVVVLHPAPPLRHHRIGHQRVVIGDRVIAPDRRRPHHRARPPARPSAATAPIVTDATDDHQKPPSATNATLADSILECKGLLRGDFAWLLSAQRLSPLPDPDGRPQLLTAREGAH